MPRRVTFRDVFEANLGHSGSTDDMHRHIPRQTPEEGLAARKASYQHDKRWERENPRPNGMPTRFDPKHHRANSPKADVPLDKVRSTQSFINHDRVASYRGKVGKGQAPVAHKHNGLYHLIDGHHHTVAAMQDGHKSMKMHVVDLDGEV